MKISKNLFFIICIIANLQNILAMEENNVEKKENKKIEYIKEALDGYIPDNTYNNILTYCNNKLQNHEKIGIFIRTEKQFTFFEKLKKLIFGYPYKEWDVKYPPNCEDNTSVSLENNNLTIYGYSAKNTENKNKTKEMFKEIDIPANHRVEISPDIACENVSSPYWPNSYEIEVNIVDKVVHKIKIDTLAKHRNPNFQNFQVAQLAATTERISSQDFKNSYQKHQFYTKLICGGLGLLVFGSVAHISPYEINSAFGLGSATAASLLTTLITAKKRRNDFEKQEKEKIDNRAIAIYKKIFPHIEDKEIEKLKNLKLNPYVQRTWNTQKKIKLKPITISEIMFNEE